MAEDQAPTATPAAPTATPAAPAAPVAPAAPAVPQDITVQIGLSQLRAAAREIHQKMEEAVLTIEKGKAELATLQGKLSVINDLMVAGNKAEADNAALAAKAKAPTAEEITAAAKSMDALPKAPTPPAPGPKPVK